MSLQRDPVDAAIGIGQQPASPASAGSSRSANRVQPGAGR